MFQHGLFLRYRSQSVSYITSVGVPLANRRQNSIDKCFPFSSLECTVLRNNHNVSQMVSEDYALVTRNISHLDNEVVFYSINSFLFSGLTSK